LHDKATHNANNKKKFEIPVVLVIAGSEGFDNTAKHLMVASYNLGYRTVAVDPQDVYDT
jgi:23S rRNA pseudoU1915 N3-methylase RlmH